MQCKKCGFLVPQNLRFAIMKNFCPQCGEKLFTDREINHISLIQNRVLQQKFSSAMDEQTAYDVALFVYNEIIGGYGRIILDEEIKAILEKRKQAVNNESSTEEDVEFEKIDEDLEKIKAQIREEEAARVALESRASVEDEDLEERVQRLKNLYKRNPIKNKPPVVRRIDSQ